MPLTNWIKTMTGGPQVPEKSSSTKICESLLMELESQIRNHEDEQRALEVEQKKARGGADYSWLSSSSAVKAYDMPQLEKLELEQLCLKVKPTECGTIIARFRESLVHEPPAHEMPKILRALVISTLESRQKEETMSEYISKSLTNLSKFRIPSRKVTPLSAEDDLEMQRSEVMTSSVSTVSFSVASAASSAPDDRTTDTFELTSDTGHL